MMALMWEATYNVKAGGGKGMSMMTFSAPDYETALDKANKCKKAAFGRGKAKLVSVEQSEVEQKPQAKVEEPKPKRPPETGRIGFHD